MPKSAATLAANFTARFSQPGSVDLSAAAAPAVVFPTDPSSIDSVQAAGVRSFSAPGKLQWVKVLSPFLVLGDTVNVDEYVQVPESDSAHLIRVESARLATDEEVAAAQKGGK